MIDEKAKILITGSTGFIGKNIVHYLKDRYTLITPSHKDLDLLSQVDVETFFLNNEIDCVIHCANFGGTRKSSRGGETIEKNLRMFFNLVENQDHYNKLIHLGSGAEYNKNNYLRQVSENEIGKSIPIDEYGFSKYLISKYIEKSEKACCLRLFGIFGKYEDYEYKFISNAVVKNLFHLPITIKQNVNFSWLYIDDFLNVLDYFLIQNPTFSSYNVIPYETMDLVSIAEMINSLSGYEFDIVVENEGFNLEYSGSNNRLANEMKNLNFTSMESALKDLIKYYKSILSTINLDTIVRDDYASFCKIN